MRHGERPTTSPLLRAHALDSAQLAGAQSALIGVRTAPRSRTGYRGACSVGRCCRRLSGPQRHSTRRRVHLAGCDGHEAPTTGRVTDPAGSRGAARRSAPPGASGLRPGDGHGGPGAAAPGRQPAWPGGRRARGGGHTAYATRFLYTGNRIPVAVPIMIPGICGSRVPARQHPARKCIGIMRALDRK